MLIFFNKLEGLNIFAALAILMREVIISGMREGLSGAKFNLPVSHLGKIKTAMQMISITILIIEDASLLHTLGLILFWVAAILSVYSGCQYCLKAWKYLAEN